MKVKFSVAVTIILLSVISVSGKLQSQEPVVIKALPAVYPLIAAVAQESGVVVVEVKIQPDGTVADALSVNGHKLFMVAAERSARQWVFNPVAEQSALRVARITFTFKLIPRTTDLEELLPVFLPPYSVEIKGTSPDYIYTKNVDPPSKKAKKQPRKRL